MLSYFPSISANPRKKVDSKLSASCQLKKKLSAQKQLKIVTFGGVSGGKNDETLIDTD